MHLHKVKNKKTNRTSLLLRESYRDEQGKSQKRTLKNYGILEDLEKTDKNILKKIEEEIKNLKKSQIKAKKFNSLYDYYEKAELIESYYSNYGYLVYAKIFEDIGLKHSIKNISKKQKQLKYDLEKAVLLQIISKLLKQESKLKNYSNKDYFLEDFSEIKLQNIYRSMDLIYENREEILKRMNQNISKIVSDRVCDLAFYDVTTHAFESQDADTLKTFGYSKDKKFNEVQIVMGLLIDKHGIPISYEIFSEETSKFGTMKAVLEQMLKTYKIDKVIVTADQRLNSKSNLKMIKDMGFDCVVETKEICDIYHNLWKIKDFFKAMKSDLESKPVHNWKTNQIRSHFFACYIAFTVQGILEYKLKTAKISVALKTLIETLNSATVNIQITDMDKIYIKNQSINDDMLKKIFDTLNLKIPKKFGSKADLLTYYL